MLQDKSKLLRKDGKIYDLASRNKSFVELYEKFTGLYGEDNDSILEILTLIRPELQGIRPESGVNDCETRKMIIKECKENPWYYFREVLMMKIDMRKYLELRHLVIYGERVE